MTTKKIYGPWIKWYGGECPVPPETMVEVKLRNRVLGQEGRAGRYFWKHDGEDDDIVEYRIVTGQADLQAAEKLLRANGYTVTPPAKPLTFENVVPMTEAPEKGTRYWVLSAVEPEGILCVKSFNDWFDQRAIKRRMAYLDKKHALVAAKHIFGLKGGEL